MPGRSDELNSWKDIASYLGVTVRTAQLWERERALPVHRLPGPRGRVYAYIEELETWKSGGSKGESAAVAAATAFEDAEIPGTANAVASAGDADADIQGVDGPPREYAPEARSDAPARKRARLAMLGLFCCAVIAVLSVIGVAKFRKGPPARYEIKPDTLIIKDAEGRELWRKPLKNAFPQEFCGAKPVAITDVNGDGRFEVIFAPSLVMRESLPLICYAADGTELWQFSPGRRVQTANETFLPPYVVNYFVIRPFGAQRGQRVVVISRHLLYYPSQIALLSGDGRLLREYWHSGQFSWAIVLDVNKDGRNDIVLVGVSNATKETTVVALDPRTMRGASAEQNPDYQLQGFEPGNELRRIMLPRSCIGRALKLTPFLIRYEETDKEMIFSVEDTPRQGPQTATLYYHFTHDLTLRSIGVGSDFQALHEKMFLRGELDHRLSDAEIDDLRRRVH